MPQYVIESRTKSGQYLATIPFRDLNGEFYYSKTRSMRFSMAQSDLNMLTTDDIYPALTEIIVYRDGEKVFCGPLWDLTISSTEHTVKCVAGDLSSYFEKRTIPVDQKLSGSYGDIAWTMITQSQSRTGGALGITRGTTVGGGAPSGTNFKLTAGKYLNEIHEDLSDGKNGFDWTITPDRVYHQYYPRLNSRANVRLEYGGNIKSYSDQIHGKYMGNSLRTVGKDGVLSDVVVDTNSRTKFGLMDHLAEQTGLSNINLLNDHNARQLDLRRVPYQSPGIVLNSTLIDPFAGDINYGQVATVVIDDGYTQYNKDMLCKGFSMFYSKSGNETFTLYMEDIVA